MARKTNPQGRLDVALKYAVDTYEWVIADHPELDPDGVLPTRLAQLKAAIEAKKKAESRASDKESREHEALMDIIDAANGHPNPIHFKVREAIDRAREAVREFDLFEDM